MAKSLMVLGTMSSAGKSFITAGLCRIFRQDGWKTVPFKSQNMALNSYITQDGKEMGRAQVMQAEAAGVQPDARMNPDSAETHQRQRLTSHCQRRNLRNDACAGVLHEKAGTRFRISCVSLPLTCSRKRHHCAGGRRKSGGDQSEVGGYRESGHGGAFRFSGNSGGGH